MNDNCCAGKLVIPDNCNDEFMIFNHLKELTIGHNCFNEISEVQFKNYPVLKLNNLEYWLLSVIMKFITAQIKDEKENWFVCLSNKTLHYFCNSIFHTHFQVSHKLYYHGSFRSSAIRNC